MATTAAPVALPETSRDGTRRIPELDGVRGLAIALVLAYHYLNVNVPGHGLFHYFALLPHLMWSGVDLFFVLSGFLIGGILLDHRDAPNYYRVFYARRIHRIFPLYYLMIGFLYVGILFFPHSPLFTGTMPLWTYPLFAQNLFGDFTRAATWISVSWSLAVEEQFYLLCPLVVRSFSRRTLALFLAACVLLAPVLRSLLVIHGWRFEQVYPLLLCRADALALGVVAAIIVRSGAAKQWVSEHSRILFLCLLTLIASTLTFLKWTSYRYVGTVGYSMLAIMYFLLIILLLVAPTRLMKGFFTNLWLCRVGVIAYCLYLIHEPIRLALFLLLGLGKTPAITDLKRFTVTVAALFLTFAVAQLSWWVLEKPLIRRAHRRYPYTT